MKRLTILLLFLNAISFAQSKFIEVEVRDTVHREIEELKYLINISDNFESFNFDSNGTENYSAVKEDKKTKLAALGTFLSKRGYNFTSGNSDDYSINNSSYASNDRYQVKLKSIEDVEKLMADLKELDYIDGRIGEISFKELPENEQNLFQKLIEKAKLKASLIAQLSDTEIGRIIQVTEVSEIDNFNFNIMDTYFTYVNSAKFSALQGKISGQKSKAIIVRFEIKD